MLNTNDLCVYSKNRRFNKTFFIENYFTAVTEKQYSLN